MSSTCKTEKNGILVRPSSVPLGKNHRKNVNHQLSCLCYEENPALFATRQYLHIQGTEWSQKMPIIRLHVKRRHSQQYLFSRLAAARRDSTCHWCCYVVCLVSCLSVAGPPSSQGILSNFCFQKKKKKWAFSICFFFFIFTPNVPFLKSQTVFPTFTFLCISGYFMPWIFFSRWCFFFNELWVKQRRDTMHQTF